MLKEFSNCFKIPELRKKILFTIGILALCRLAANVPCPGIDPEGLEKVFESMSEATSAGGGAGVLDMFNMFTGGALQRFAVAALGIMPYITASIIMQLMTPIFPTLEKWKREGESGHQKMNQWTRYMTLGICLVQGYLSATVMENPGALLGSAMPEGVSVVINPGIPFRIMTVIILTCGTMILMWLGERITDSGVGNGASLIITIGILEMLPNALVAVWDLLLNQGQGTSSFTIIHLLILVALFILVTAATVALTMGVRQIPLQYARPTTNRQGAQAQTRFFPLRVNYSNVMPIIFASALLMFPPLVLDKLTQSMPWLAYIAPAFEFATTPYMIIYAALLILFAFFWVANQFNPIQIAEDLKRSGAFIPGRRPGKETADYLDWSMTRVTAAGATFLTVIALLPMLFNRELDIPFMIASFFGGASLLIIVGVMLDTIGQVESHLKMHGYDSFLKRGRLRSRSTFGG